MSAMMMRNTASSSLFMWALVASMLTQNLVMSISFDDQKNYYTPDPGTRTPPPSGHGGSSPPGGSYGSSPPSHHTTPSHHGSHTPSPSPPTNCGTPPSRPSRPSTPSTPTPTPSRPSTPTYVTPPSTPSSPPVVVTPPVIGTPPIDPGTPSVPIPPYFPSAPTPPYFPVDPHSPPFTCTYWTNHPTAIWALCGWWATLGHTFGLSSPTLPGVGSSSSLNLLEALSNTRADGLGQLYREGTAALLNSMVDNKFHFTATQVRDSFVRGLSSNKAAATQARLFRLANEGKLKPRA